MYCLAVSVYSFFHIHQIVAVLRKLVNLNTKTDIILSVTLKFLCINI